MWPSEMRTAHSDAPLGVRSHNGTSAIVHGMVLSIMLFCTTVYAIHYSGIHVLNLRILESVFHPHQEILPSTKPNHFASSSAKLIPGGSDKARLIPDHLQVDVIPIEREGTAGIEKNSPKIPTILGCSGRCLYSFDLSRMLDSISPNGQRRRLRLAWKGITSLSLSLDARAVLCSPYRKRNS